MSVGLDNLVDTYKENRAEFMRDNWFRRLTPFFRMFGAAFITRRLLKLEVELQSSAKQDAKGLIGLNKISKDDLKMYSHSLKTISHKYLERSTFIVISLIMLGVIVAPHGPLVLVGITDIPSWFSYMVDLLVIGVLVERHYINSQVAVYQELALLIDFHLDDET